jgi:ElaA protein
VPCWIDTVSDARSGAPERFTSSETVRWTWARFDGLGSADLYDALALRARVFVVEQRCAYLDPDGADRSSAHLLGRNAAGALVAYLRVVDPGVKFAEPSIGRVVTAPEVRGSGAGRALMSQGIARCMAAWPGRGIRIGAQAHLAPFYASLGFIVTGEPYDEDGIPHVEMWRTP